jgi:hypothetical protein
MSAATSNRQGQRQPSEKVPYTGASGYTYYKDTLQVMAPNGTVQPYAGTGTSGAYFIGVNDNKVDLSAGLGSSNEIMNVWKTGEFTFEANGTGATADIGKRAYAIDDQTVGASGGANASLWVGEIVGLPSTSSYRVRIDNAVGVAVGISNLLQTQL